MSAATFDTYMNIFLFVAIFGGVAYGLYRVLRTKKPQVIEIPKRPGEHKPRVKQEETDGYPEEWVGGPPITDWRELPTREPSKSSLKAPSFRKVINKPRMSKVKSFKAIEATEEQPPSTSPHSPLRQGDGEPPDTVN
jgi:hypothetical protein